MIALIVVAVFLLLDYQSRTNQLYQVQNERDLIEQEVIKLRQTEQALQAALDYANSPAMVEQFAREELGAVQPGDVRIVPYPDDAVTPTPTPVILPTQSVVKNSDVWKALFFE